MTCHIISHFTNIIRFKIFIFPFYFFIKEHLINIICRILLYK